MSKDQYYYQPASPEKLNAELAKVFDSMQSDGQRYLKSGTINTVIVVKADFDRQAIEDLIYTLTLVHPNRAFLVVLDETADKIKADFSTRCHKISKDEHVCSEVIRLFGRSSDIPALRQILRANFITGTQTELVLVPGLNPLQVFMDFGMLAEQVIYNSAIFKESVADQQELLNYQNTLIDLEWVNLGAWREQVKDLFNFPAAREMLTELQSIEIKYGGEKNSALLLAGWITSRLEAEPRGRSGGKESDTYKLASRLFGEFKLKSEFIAGAPEGVQELTFFFEKDGGYIKITRRDQVLLSEVKIRELIRASRPIEPLSFNEQIKRYFFIGESYINYKDSLANSLKLL